MAKGLGVVANSAVCLMGGGMVTATAEGSWSGQERIAVGKVNKVAACAAHAVALAGDGKVGDEAGRARRQGTAMAMRRARLGCMRAGSGYWRTTGILGGTGEAWTRRLERGRDGCRRRGSGERGRLK